MALPRLLAMVRGGSARLCALAAGALWALVYNNQKVKVALKGAGVGRTLLALEAELSQRPAAAALREEEEEEEEEGGEGAGGEGRALLRDARGGRRGGGEGAEEEEEAAAAAALESVSVLIDLLDARSAAAA
eukprot:tig00000282_g23848.t1